MHINQEKFNKTAFEYNKALHPILMSVCDPLFSSANIKHFRYMKMFNDYTYFSLGTNLDYLCHYLANLKEPGKIFEPERIFSAPSCNIQKTNFRYFLWPNNYSKNEKDPLFNTLYEFDVWNGFTISRKQENYVETWSFATSKNNDNMHQFYINNIQLLDCFVFYFHNRMSEFINNVSTEQMAVFQNPFNLNFQTEGSSKELANFLNKDKIVKIVIKNKKISFTQREFECLFHAAMGNSLKKIGTMLKISPRTVESHIQSVKDKTGVHFKSDLICLIPANELFMIKFMLESQANSCG